MGVLALNLEIVHCGKDISDLLRHKIETQHYSGTARSQLQVHVFEIRYGEKVVGGAVFGLPISHWSNDGETLELRRLVIDDDMPVNTASFFLGSCLRWISKNRPDLVKIVTFADPNVGHRGTIYKACNFMEDGEENSKNPRVVIFGDKKIHLRQMFQKRQGGYSADALRIQAAIRDGKAIVAKQKRKLRYIYWLR